MPAKLKPADLINRLYADHPQAREVLLRHSRLVTRKALTIARALRQRGVDVDVQFVAEAAMLHDIGMIATTAPEIGCRGEQPYLQHGIIGARMLRERGLPRHARVCERHTGVGLTAAEIIRQQLPLPPRDLLPETLEEQIICYADLFYSKDPDRIGVEKSAEQIRRQLARYGADKPAVFDRWHRQFEAA